MRVLSAPAKPWVNFTSATLPGEVGGLLDELGVREVVTHTETGVAEIEVLKLVAGVATKADPVATSEDTPRPAPLAPPVTEAEVTVAVTAPEPGDTRTLTTR
jgi:hypothetical protein